MRIVGEWHQCDDGITRPTVMARVEAQPAVFCDKRFLVDIGADRTVLSALLLTRLGLTSASGGQAVVLAGIGGTQTSVTVQTALEFDHEGGTAVVRGQFTAFTDPAATDMSILGRNVLNNFDLI